MKKKTKPTLTELVPPAFEETATLDQLLAIAQLAVKYASQLNTLPIIRPALADCAKRLAEASRDLEEAQFSEQEEKTWKFGTAHYASH